jgi:hypothetical protein
MASSLFYLLSIRVHNSPYYGRSTNEEEMEMDELKIVLNSRFMRGLVTKMLAKTIQKKTGYRVDIQLNELKADVYDGKIRLHADLDAELNSEDLVTMLKSKDLM